MMNTKTILWTIKKFTTKQTCIFMLIYKDSLKRMKKMII